MIKAEKLGSAAQKGKEDAKTNYIGGSHAFLRTGSVGGCGESYGICG